MPEEYEEHEHEEHDVEQADALGALAAGEFVHPDDKAQTDEPDDQQDEGGEIDFQSFEADVDGDNDGVAPVDFSAESAAPTLADKKKHTASFKAHTQKAHAEQFKKTMIPLFFTVGALLMAAAYITMYMMVSHDAGYMHEVEGQRVHPIVANGLYLIIGTIPMSLIMFLGGYLFISQLKHEERRKQSQE